MCADHVLIIAVLICFAHHLTPMQTNGTTEHHTQTPRFFKPRANGSKSRRPRRFATWPDAMHVAEAMLASPPLVDVL